MINFIRKHKYAIIFTLIIVMVTLVYLSLSEKTKEEIKTETPQKEGSSYQSLTPGKSSKEDVIDKLGEPVQSDSNGNLLKFNSSSSERPHEVVFEQNKVLTIIESVTLEDEKKVNDIEEEFGNTEYILYGPHSASGFDLYVYPENGIAYVGHSESGLLIEVWYFPPTTFEEFKKKYATDHSLTPPSGY